MKFVLFYENFKLELCPKTFIENIEYPNNTSMAVTVQSDGFAGSATMDIGIKDLCKFAADLCQIYDTLSGEARIEEPYGLHMYLSFSGDGKGRVVVKGYLHQGNRTGNENSLEFENYIDQTVLKPFCFPLLSACNEYIPSIEKQR